MSDPISITTFFLGLIDRVIKVLGWFKKKLGGSKLSPAMAISFVPQRHMWTQGGRANEPGMQLMSDWWMTNNTNTHVFILRAEIVYWNGLRRRVLNQMQFMGEVTAGSMGEVRLLFWIIPPVRKEDEDLKARIFMIDNFNRKHNAGKVVFKSPTTRKFPD
jgi:hypothetical protein